MSSNMNSGNSNNFEEERIDSEAAEWMIKHDRSLSPVEQDDFFQWLAKDPRHGEFFAKHRADWDQFDLLVEWRPEHSEKPNPDLLAQHSPKKTTWLRWSSYALATAAAIMMIFTVYRQNDISPEYSNESQTTYIVSKNYEYQILEDGTELDMKDGAELLVKYTDETRLVQLLKGEVHFTVAKNPNRPFVVVVNDSEIIAVGTAFNIRVEEEVVDVLVTEGRVRVEVSNIPSLDKPIYEPILPISQELIVGQRSILSVDNTLSPVQDVDTETIQKMLSWKHELLDFDSTPLSQVIIAFNQRNEIQFEISDINLETLPITASFRSNNVEGFARLLELTGEANIDRSRKNIITLKQ